MSPAVHSLLTVALAGSLALPAVSPASAAAEQVRPASSGAFSVSIATDSPVLTKVNIRPRDAVPASGDIVISPDGAWIYVDPDSRGTVRLAAGSGCAEFVPPGRTAAEFPPGTSIGCDVPTTAYVDIDLTGLSEAASRVSFISLADMGTSFRGSAYSDEFYGGKGKDSVDGAGGDDVIFGGGGDDWLLGGEGRDLIDGEGGSDVVYGDAGADTITVDEDGEADWVNCNNFDRAVQNTDNDPDNPPINRVFADRGLDRVTDCGVAAAPVVKTYPTVSGTPVTGQPFTAQAGTWEGKGLLLSYAWFACPTPTSAIPFLDDDEAGDCTEVAARDGDKGLAYTPKASDTGRYLVLRATARNNSGFAVAVSGYSGAVKAASLAPGPVRELSAKLAVTKVRATRFLNVTVTWKAPDDPGPGVKNYVVEVDGLDTPRVVTGELAHTFTVTPYPKNHVITVKVSAQGPKGASQQGPSAKVSKRTPRV